MTDQIIIADAGPLIAFARIHQLDLLVKLFGEVAVPLPVFKESTIDSVRPGAKEILTAAEGGRISIFAVSNQSATNDFTEDLGAGEASAIHLAIEQNARLLIDEKLGRQVAEKLNISIIGTAGVLVIAKQKNLIKAVKPLLNQLKSFYFLSDELIKVVLAKANET